MSSKLPIGLLFIIFYLLFSTGATAQTATSQYRPGVTAEGAVYYLPTTAIRVTVLVEKTAYQPGDFARYAQRYLRLNDVSLEPQTGYRVVSLTQMPVGMADAQKAYAVKFNAKSVAPNVALADDGRLLAINAEPEADDALPAPFAAAPKAPAQNPRRFMSEEIITAGSTAKMAELTSREIYDLRENRSLLIKGQADFMPKDGEQLRLMLARLDEQEQALTSLFAGTTTCDTTEHVITFVPTRPVERQQLFRLSQQAGLVDADDLSGAPYYITVEDLDVLPAVADEDSITRKKGGLLGFLKKDKDAEQGVYVNVPGRMRSTIYRGIDQIDQQEMPAAQFGRVELLSAELFNKQYTTRLWLSPVTGAIARIDAEMNKK